MNFTQKLLATSRNSILFCLPVFFLGCATGSVSSNGELKTFTTENATKNTDFMAILKEHERGISYRYGTAEATFTLLSEVSASITTGLLIGHQQPAEKNVPPMLERILHSAVDNATCFSIRTSSLTNYYASPTFHSNEFKAIVVNDLGEVDWLNFSGLNSSACTSKKIRIDSNIYVVLKHSYYSNGKEPSYYRLTWKTNSALSSKSSLNSLDTQSLYLGLEKQMAPQIEKSLHKETSENYKLLLASMRADDFQAFKKVLPANRKRSLSELDELSGLYFILGVGGSTCSQNRYFKHVESLGVREELIALQLEVTSKHERWKYLACPELATMAFKYSTILRDSVPQEFADSFKYVSSAVVSSPGYLSALLGFYSTLTDHYFEACAKGAADQCIYFKKYRSELASLKTVVSRVRANQILNRQIEEILKKRKLKSKDGKTDELI